MGTLFTCSISANEMSSCASVSATGRGIALDREGGRAINSPPSFHTLASALPLGTPLRPDDDDGACVTQELHRNGGSAGVHLHDLHSLRFYRAENVANRVGTRRWRHPRAVDPDLDLCMRRLIVAELHQAGLTAIEADPPIVCVLAGNPVENRLVVRPGDFLDVFASKVGPAARRGSPVCVSEECRKRHRASGDHHLL